MTIADQAEAFRSEDFYRNFLRAREAVIAMNTVPPERIPEFARPSKDGNEDLGIFASLFDASPAIIAQLRRHYHRLTGIPTDRYRYDNEAEERPLFENKLRALRSLDMSDLFVPESPALGGLGYELSAGLANLETLKIYECTLAMDRGSALAALKRLPERQVVLDISPGWGGLAYALKTLLPNTCFVLCDLPELFLFSATYLSTVFPRAKIAFVTPDASELNDNWATYDFIFVPQALYHEIKPERLDLMVDSGSSRPMAGEQRAAYVKLAASLGCPIVYSLCPGAPDDASKIVEQAYWLSEVPMLLVSHTTLLDPRLATDVQAVAARWRKAKSKLLSPSAQTSEGERADIDHKHLVGWKRLG